MHCPLANICQTNLLQQSGAASLIRAFELGKKTQGLQSTQVVIEHQVFWQVTDFSACNAKIAAAHRRAGHLNLTGRGGNQAEHHLEQRALAGAVVANQAKQLTALHGQFHTIDRMHIAIVFAHTVQRNRYS